MLSVARQLAQASFLLSDRIYIEDGASVETHADHLSHVLEPRPDWSHEVGHSLS
jgi:hypothetical protein